VRISARVFLELKPGGGGGADGGVEVEVVKEVAQSSQLS
jgi:hypothetical protein